MPSVAELSPEIIAYTRQKSLFQRLEVVSNNVANADTAGFKAELAVYTENKDRLDGKVNPTPKLNISTSQAQGGMKVTGNQLDVAIQGEGFFSVETPLGTRYTRSGGLSINAEGQLVTKEGYTFLGDGGPIQLDPSDSEIEIGDNGEVTAITAEGRQLRGTISVQKFENNAGLIKVGQGNFRSSEAPVPAEVLTDFKVVQGALEDSNVNSISQMTELINLSRSVQQVAKIIENQHSMQRDTVSKLAGPN